MKQIMSVIFSFGISFCLNSCFVYQNTTSWKQQFEKTDDILLVNVEFELNQAQRFLCLPFLFVVINKGKEKYSPLLTLQTKIDSAKSLIDFKYILFDLNGNKIFSDIIKDTVELNKILDYMALHFDFNREDLVVGLKEKKAGEIIMVDYEFTLLYSYGSEEKFSFKHQKLIKIQTKKLGSFF